MSYELFYAHGSQLIAFTKQNKKTTLTIKMSQSINKSAVIKTTIAALVALVLWILPTSVLGLPNISPVEHRVIAVFALALILWFTEAIPSWKTSILIIVVLLLMCSDQAIILLQTGGKEAFKEIALSHKTIMGSFADPTIMLFIGGFVIAIMASKMGIDVQLARVLLKPFGTQSKFVLLGFIMVTGVFSMFISNTATAAMMLTFMAPVLRQLPSNNKGRIALILSIPIGANIGGMGWGEMFASAKYIELLNETGRNDWRPDNYKIVDARAAFIEPTYDASHKLVFRFIKKDSETVENYAQFDAVKNGATVTCKDAEGTSYTLTPVSEEEEIYTINYNGTTYEGVLDYFITLNRVYPQFYITKCSREGEDSHLHSPIISRLGEIYLNRAEAYAKLGNYGAALNDLNIIRERSIVGGGYASLDASNAGDLIDKERQLELAYQAERSYDVFRNGKPLDRTFPGPHNQAEIVEASDYRVTYYIPQNAINAYPGTLTQNPTSNSGVILN